MLLDVDSDDTRLYLVFISQLGIQYELTEKEASKKEASKTYWYNTGLEYMYQNQEQVQADYSAGLFTPFFTV